MFWWVFRTWSKRETLLQLSGIKNFSPSLAVNNSALAEVCSALSQFTTVTVLHVRREANSLAHELCHNFAMNAKGYAELSFQFTEPDWDCFFFSFFLLLLLVSTLIFFYLHLLQNWCALLYWIFFWALCSCWLII